MRSGQRAGRPTYDSSGLVTPLAAASCSGLIMLAYGLCAVGGVLVADRRADSAADLAALAGAGAAQEFADPCVAADEVARDNGTELTRCSARGPVVEVEVRGTVRLPWGQSLDVAAGARAGPVSAG
ncbi:MAG: flp pilus-assembly TadE/G-like family protein [Nocardioidaceae bacterium]